MITVPLCYAIIYGCSAIGIIYAFVNYYRVKKVDLVKNISIELGNDYGDSEDITLTHEKIGLML